MRPDAIRNRLVHTNPRAVSWLRLSLAGALGLVLLVGGCPPPADPGDGDPNPGPGNTPDPTNNDPIIQNRGLTDVKIVPAIPDRTRQFRLGAVAVGAANEDFTVGQLEVAVDRVAESAECIVVRPLIDWEYFRPNRPVDAQPVRLAEMNVIVEMAQERGVELSLIQLDPIANRASLSPLPASLAGQDFSSPDIRAALRDETIALLNLFSPTYLSVGVEVNGYLEANPDDFENYITLHRELYDEIKARSPQTKVALSLHYETLLRIDPLPGGSADDARRALIERFLPQVDVVAISSLPWPAFSDPIYVPLDYAERVSDFTDLPVIFSEIAWTTDPASDSDEQEQLDYIAIMSRALLNAPQVELVAWAFMSDPPPGTVLDGIESFTRIGLYDTAGVEKPALSLWRDLHALPYRR